MKGVCDYYVSCLLVWLLSGIAATASNEEAEFDRILTGIENTSIIYPGEEDEFEKWSGLKTKTGFAIALDRLILNYATNENKADRATYKFSRWVLKHTELPKTEVVKVIMQRSEHYTNNPQHMYFCFKVLDRYSEDDSLIPFITKHMSDTRAVELYKVARPDSREMKLDYSTRVCDKAATSAIIWLDKRGLWERDTSEEYYRMSYRERSDARIDRVNKILLEKGFIDYAVSPSDPVPRDRFGRAKDEADAGGAARQGREEGSVSREGQPVGAVFPRWGWALVIGLVLCGLALWLKARSRSQ